MRFELHHPQTGSLGPDAPGLRGRALGGWTHPEEPAGDHFSLAESHSTSTSTITDTDSIGAASTSSHTSEAVDSPSLHSQSPLSWSAGHVSGVLPHSAPQHAVEASMSSPSFFPPNPTFYPPLPAQSSHMSLGSLASREMPALPSQMNLLGGNLDQRLHTDDRGVPLSQLQRSTSFS